MPETTRKLWRSVSEWYSGGTANYVLAQYVGRQAVTWFVLDAEMGPDEE